MPKIPVIEADTDFGPIRFAGKSVHNGTDYFVKANAPLNSVKIILFFDSRGLSGDWEHSLLGRLIHHFQSINYLAVCRPIELTTWATLFNFILLNKVHPDLLITNVGIVDFTPKKYDLCKDMLDQIRYASPPDTSILLELGEWSLSNGMLETLFTIEYSESYSSLMKSRFKSLPLLAIKSPLIHPEIQIDRRRPPSFFHQLVKTNKFIDWLGCNSVDLGAFSRRFTYDAVHWTQEGNLFVFNEVIKHL